MEWSDINELKRDLGLEGSADNIDALQREITTRLGDLHPDRSGGTFPSKEAEAKYHRLNEAKSFLDKNRDGSHHLIPAAQVSALITALRDSALTVPRKDTGSLRNECRAEMKSEFSSRFFMPRLSSGVFFAVATAFFAFGRTLKDDPFLSVLATSTSARSICLISGMYAGAFFIFTWFIERRENARVEWAMSEPGRLNKPSTAA